MGPRIENPSSILPEAVTGIQTMMGAVYSGGVSKGILDLVHLRASEMNGCHVCVEAGTCEMRKAGESDERLDSVAAWRSATGFTEAERAALGLAEAVTRLDDADPVPDAVWNEAARHFDERGLATLVLMIGTTNLFNRINVATRQAGRTW